MALGAKHLGKSPGALLDALASAAHWRSPPPGARIRTDDSTAGSDPAWELALDWDLVVDPVAPELSPHPRTAPWAALGADQKRVVALSTGLHDAKVAATVARRAGSQPVQRARALQRTR
jgi:hypothetical protein